LPGSDRNHERDLTQLDRIAALLDSKFRLPGTRIHFGWDSILGLVPVVGDAATSIPAGYLILKGYRLGARKRTTARKVLNTGLDATIGAIPVIGDLFDLFFKANRRNFRLLQRELKQRGVGAPQGRR
jgi:hypothetical protein